MSGSTAELTASPRSRFSKRAWFGLLLVVAGLLVGLYGSARAWATSSLRAARMQMARERWPEATVTLGRCLWITPQNYEARLMLAECLTADGERAPEDSARAAIEQLDRIPADSVQGPEGLIRAARLQFLVLHRPDEAERRLRRALEIDGRLDAHAFLWKLLGMTQRFHESAPHFWKVFESAPESAKAELLREWYLCEFGSGSAYTDFDRIMGFLGQDEQGSLTAEVNRATLFQDNAPEWPVGNAGLARLLLRLGRVDRAVEILDAASSQAALNDPFFISVAIETALKAGQFEKATKLHAAWPGPHDSPEYFKWTGILAEEVEHDYPAAIAAYSRAVEDWLERTDWQLWFRLAHCQVRTGKPVEGAELRSRASRIEHSIEREEQQRLRRALNKLDDPQAIETVAAFYDLLNREREAGAWRECVSRLRVEGERKSGVIGSDPGSPGSR